MFFDHVFVFHDNCFCNKLMIENVPSQGFSVLNLDMYLNTTAVHVLNLVQL